jgi:microcystin-dependent protein
LGTPYLSEIRIMSFNFPPRGWVFCNGQTMAINQNQALFALIGTFYGGDGIRTFGLPNLQGRVPLHMGSGFTIGQQGGEVSHTLLTAELPPHIHTMQASTGAGVSAGPSTDNGMGQPVTQVGAIYGPVTTPVTMAPQAVSPTGGSQPHNNLQPYLVLSFCMAIAGIFPSRN